MHRSLLVNYVEILTDLLKRKFEKSWFEFKENWFEAEKLGKYISALSNVALINRIYILGVASASQLVFLAKILRIYQIIILIKLIYKSEKSDFSFSDDMADVMRFEPAIKTLNFRYSTGLSI